MVLSFYHQFYSCYNETTQKRNERDEGDQVNSIIFILGVGWCSQEVLFFCKRRASIFKIEFLVCLLAGIQLTHSFLSTEKKQ
jgi:hypothetical protein